MKGREKDTKNDAKDRREFLKTILKFSASVGVLTGGSLLFLFHERNGYSSVTPVSIKDFSPKNFKKNYDLVVGKGKKHYEVTKKALYTFISNSKLIKKGSKVLIKPNIAWNRPKELGANTNPEVLRAVIEVVLEMGVSKIYVTDNPCNAASKTYKISGAEEVCKKTGAILKFLDEKKDYRPLVGSKTFLDSWRFLKLFEEVDHVINVPVVKSHSLARATISMKNWFGAITGKRSLLHQNIHQTIAFFGKIIKPTLVVADATRVMMKNGPSGGTLGDVKIYDEVIIGTDQVLVDAYGSLLLNLKEKYPEYIHIAARIGAGSKDVDKAKKNYVKI